MNPKLIKTLLLAAAIGCFLLWILEYYRTDLSSSYWLLMLGMTILLGRQYFDAKTQPTPKTERTAPRPEKRSSPPPKRKKKK